MTAAAAGFTAHNIRFQDGTVTMPGHPTLLADEAWWGGAKRVLSLIYGGDPSGRRIADLGCLEGGHALEFARMGMDALGIEVRRGNYERCLEVGRRAGLRNLSFVRDDAWNLARYGPFDAVYCCGLLYHLDRPREFVQLMGAQARDVVILNTHFAPWDWEPAPAFALSPIVEHEGLPGRWFHEHDAEDEAARERLPWASWENRRSFWPAREALLHCLREAGFDLVFQQHDAEGGDILGEATRPEARAFCRGTFVGIRTGAAATRRLGGIGHGDQA